MTSRTNQPPAPPNNESPFFQQRNALVGEIAVALENVLQNINKLNRSLEGVIAVRSLRLVPLAAKYIGTYLPVYDLSLYPDNSLCTVKVGNEFGAVEALWSQFEGVMSQEGTDGTKEAGLKESEEGSGADDNEDAEEEDETEEKAT